MADFPTFAAILDVNEGFTGAVEPDPAPGAPNAVARDGINSAANQMPDGFYDGTMPNDQALALALAVYRANYWNAVMGDNLPGQTLANQIADHAVNAGTGGAVKLLQAVLNDQTPSAGLTVDGNMGAKTLAAVLACDPTVLASAYRKARVGYYVATSFNPGKAEWLGTWLGRLPQCG